MRAARLLNPVALFVSVIRMITTFALIDAYEWCMQKPKTCAENSKKAHKMNCVAGKAQTAEQNVNNTSSNNNSSNCVVTGTPLSCDSM